MKIKFDTKSEIVNLLTNKTLFVKEKGFVENGGF